MKRSLLFSLCIALFLLIATVSAAIMIGEGPVELSPDEYVNITPVNSTESYRVPQATVLGALDEASVLGKFEYRVAADLSPEEGNLSIISINDIDNEVVNGTPSAWDYWVNGEKGTTGPAVTNVTDGDNLTYTYGPPDHSIDNASYTLNVSVSVPGAVVTPTPTENVTPTPTENVTPTPTVNVTPTPTENVTPTPTVNVTPTPTVNVTPAAEANVTILSPEEGASIAAGNVTVEVNLTNFTLVEPTGQPNAPGEGHLHYYLDAVVPTNASAPAIPETGGYVISTNTSYTWENVTPGEHNLSVQVVHNDHTPLIPLVYDTVNVTVTGEENVTPTPTENVTPTPTVNVTPTPTVNVTPTPTVNVTPTPTVNVTPTPTVNVTPTPTVNVTPTPTVNVTPTPTVNVTPTPTVNVTPTPTVNVTPTPIVNVTPTPTVNVTPTPTENVTPTPTVNVTPTPTENVTPTPTVNVTPTPTVNVTPAAEANVTILSPEEGASIAAGNVTVEVNLTNFTLVEPTGQPNAPGEGHLHYYLDAVVPTNASAPAIPETGGYVISTNTSYTWENVTPGEHNFSVQVVHNDHTPLIPLVYDTVNVTVTGEENVTPTPTENVTPTPTVNVTPTPTVNVTPTPTVNVTPTPTVNVTPTPTVNVTPTPTENVTPTPNVADKIITGLSEEENLTTYVGLVNNSTIGDELDVNRTYLVCAPTNDAFAGLGNQTLLAIQNDTTLLNRILAYHIIEGDYTLEELAELCQNATDGRVSLMTVEGSSVNVSLNNSGQLVINNVTVVDHIQITNTITVYVLDGVLIPPGTTLPTPTPTENVTPTPTENVTPTPTVNVTPTPTVNVTPTPTVNVTPTPTENVTPTPTVNVTPTPTVNVTPTPTVNVTPTPTVNVTPTPTVNVTPTPTVNVTPTPTVNVTPTPTVNVTPTPTVNVTPTPTENVTPTPTVNVTPTPTENVTPTPTVTPGVPAKSMKLELYKGWNFVSIPRPLSPGNNTAIEVFRDVETGGRPIYTYTPENGFEPLGADTTLKVLDGYWVYSTEAMTVQLNFSTNPVMVPASKMLSPGWNAIGYSDLTPRSANESLISVEDSWVSVVGYNAKNQNYQPALINGLTGAHGENQKLLPTKGYWLFMREDGTLAAINA